MMRNAPVERPKKRLNPWLRFAAEDEEFEVFEIGEDGEGEFLVPGVALGLETMAGIKVFGGFLASQTKRSRPSTRKR